VHDLAGWASLNVSASASLSRPADVLSECGIVQRMRLGSAGEWFQNPHQPSKAADGEPGGGRRAPKVGWSRDARRGGQPEAEVDVAVRAVRGATRVDVDERERILSATRELVSEILDNNELKPADVVSVVFTATRDLTAVAPAVAARQLGLHEAALICAQEMWVAGSMPRVVRLLAHVETERPREAVVNVYLRGTEVLRADVPPIPRAGSAGSAS
jgi:chorismate mutase